MAEYHVGCGLAGIYAGRIKKNGYEWAEQSEVTNEAINAVGIYLLGKKSLALFAYNGKRYKLAVEEETSNDGTAEET